MVSGAEQRPSQHPNVDDEEDEDRDRLVLEVGDGRAPHVVLGDVDSVGVGYDQALAGAGLLQAGPQLRRVEFRDGPIHGAANVVAEIDVHVVEGQVQAGAAGTDVLGRTSTAPR